MTTRSLSADQIAVLRVQFDVMDQNKDGRITGDELAKLLSREAYAHLTAEQRQQVIDSYTRLDVDGDGGVGFDEFVTLVTNPEDPREAYRQTFDSYDLDGDGFLTAADFVRITEEQGEKLTKEQAEEMIQAADANQDGKVSFEEYYTILTSGSSG
jgi:calcium-binding protein CML